MQEGFVVQQDIEVPWLFLPNSALPLPTPLDAREKPTSYASKSA
jgi:hypothetical protein